MRRRLRLAFLFAAALLQLSAPVAAYARVARLPDAIELCSAAKAAARGAQPHGNPLRKPVRAHCAESLCCIGSATGASAPPGMLPRARFGELTGAALAAEAPSAGPASIISAAPARAPPLPF